MNNYFFFEKTFILLTYSNFILPKIILCIVAILLVKPSFKTMLQHLRPKTYTDFRMFKINNFFYNELYVCTYVIFFIVLLFLFRLNRVGASLDLNPIVQFIYSLFSDKEYVLIILFLLWSCVIGFFFIGIMKQLKDKLDLELIKRHLVLYTKTNYVETRTCSKVINLFLDMLNIWRISYPGLDYQKSTGIYNLFIYSFTFYLSKPVIISFLVKPVYFLWELFHEFEHKNIANIISKTYIYLNRMLYFMLSTIFFSSMNFLLISYDMLYNNFVLTKIFNFLPIYFVYLLWNKVNKAIVEKNVILSNKLHEIVYDLYYHKHEVKYLCLSEQQVNVVKLFVREGLTYNDERFGCDVISLSTRILHDCQYKLIDKNKLIYKNDWTKKMFYIYTENNKDNYHEIF